MPVIRLTYDGMEMDLLYACVHQRSVPENRNLLDDKFVKAMDKQCVRSLNGYLVTEEILRSVPSVFTCWLTLSCQDVGQMPYDLFQQAGLPRWSFLGHHGGENLPIVTQRISIHSGAQIQSFQHVGVADHSNVEENGGPWYQPPSVKSKDC
ncbi:poly(A) polymerase type 3-like [Cheilinus undulatus]|uniref:poly(A) polymerase type 3-like n=1 Tax=Cheilinus undulatus TaxID=241271 RepID=UPI001BD3F04A|nr:poly(A) polymerase type 3-like [Cheilinus undulatus]